MTTQQQQSQDSQVRAAYARLKPYLKRHKKIRNIEAAPLLKVSKNNSRGILAKLTEISMLVAVIGDENDPKVIWYYSNEARFYRPKQLFELLPPIEVDRITDHIKEEPRTIEDLSRLVYGDPSGKHGRNFMATLLEHYIKKGAIELKKDAYQRTAVSEHFGLSVAELPFLDAVALENRAFASEVQRGAKLKTPTDLIRVVEQDRAAKSVKPIDITPLLKDPNHWAIGFSAEQRIGDQNFDARNAFAFLNREVPGYGKFSALVFSDLLAGGFNIRGTQQKLTLTEGIERTAKQFAGAGIFLTEAERHVAGPVFVVAGARDERINDDDVALALLASRRSSRFGVDHRGFSYEKNRRFNIAQAVKLLKYQSEEVWKYQCLIGRGLLDEDEVEKLIGERVHEYFLLLRIKVAVRNNIPYPEKYEKVVNVKAFFESQIGQRIVTPDSLILKIGDEETIQVVAGGSNFTSITQYQRPDAVLEAMVSRLGALGITPPRFIIDPQQEFFQAHVEQGTWFVSLGGNSDPDLQSRFRMRQVNSRPLDSPARRQIRVRKVAPRPSNVAIEHMPDGRIRWHFHNKTIEAFLQAEARRPEETNVIAILTDEQLGSLTGESELSMKYLDWAGQDGGGLPSTELWHIGDALQGRTIYRKYIQENKGLRILDIDGQQHLYAATRFPLIKQAPQIRRVRAVPGNHEYDNIGAQLDGVSYLRFFETELNAWIEAQLAAGKQPVLQDVRVADRDRWQRTTNPEKDMFMAPFVFEKYFGDVDEPGGIGLAMMHTWALRHRAKGVSGPPIYEQRAWGRKMGPAASHINVSIGGDKHCLWLGEENDRIMIQCAPGASQSGLEVQLGLMSQVAFQRLIISNRYGIIFEVVPWKMLMDYRCQSPFLKGKDKDLERPRPGTRDYDLGRFSPLVESLIDETIIYSNTSGLMRRKY